MSANTESKSIKDQYFKWETMKLAAYYSVIIAAMLCCLTDIKEIATIPFKFAIFLGVLFVSMLSFINLQHTLDAKNREILIAEISKLVK